MAKVCILDSPSWLLFAPRSFLHLGILYLAGALRRAGHEVRVLDCHELTSWNKEEHKLIIHHNKLPDCDVLAISATTANVHWGQQLAKEWPNAKYKIIGGSHVSYILEGPHEKFKKPQYFEGFDYMMSHESEESLVAFCDAVGKGVEPKKQLIPQIPNLRWFDSSGNLHKNPHLGLPDVTTLARPAFDLWESPFAGGGLTLNSKTGGVKDYNNSMTASLYTARGCPYGCKFCADARTKVREETLGQITEDCKTLAGLGAVGLRIQDDVLTLKSARCRQLADIFHDHGFAWRGNTRVNLVDGELFKYMASKGATECGFGCEHASDDMLKKMGKGTTAKQNEIGVKLAQDAGIFVKIFMLIGFPGETTQTIDEMQKWIEKVKPNAVAFSLFQPYPGSDVWNHPETYGVELPDGAFSRFWQSGLEGTEDELILTLPSITKKELLKARRELGAWLDNNIGHRDRTRLDSGGLGGSGVFVSDQGTAGEAMMT